MKCVISNHCVKLFGRSIHCLARIGDELFLEALSDGLALRAVNSSRSAYSSFQFSADFFHSYTQGVDAIVNSNPAEMLKCKLAMKSCLGIFKSLATIEKTVDQCTVEFRPDQCRLVFVLHCRHGITKTHNLTYQECESLQAVYSKELCPNVIVAQSKVLQDTVSNFPNNCDEITVRVNPQQVHITNYIDGEPDFSKIMNTAMTLAPEEFDDFQIGVDTEVTFCLKELRAILAFSDFVNQPVSMHFEHAGKPIILALDNDTVYQAHFVLATLSNNTTADNNPPTPAQSALSQTVTSIKSLPSQTPKSVPPEKPKLENLKVPTNDKKQTKSNRPVNGKTSEKRLSAKEQFLNSICNEQKKKSAAAMVIVSDKVDFTRSVVDIDPFFTSSCPLEELMDPKDDAAIVEEEQKQLQRNHNTSLNSSILRKSQRSITAAVIDNDDFMDITPPRKKKAIFFEPVAEEKSSTVLLCADTDDESE